MVASHESLITNGTGESFLTCVRPQVALQLVGPREPLAAEEPITDERPLARVPAQMRLQVARLPVHFSAARDVAAVYVLLPQMHACRP